MSNRTEQCKAELIDLLQNFNSDNQDLREKVLSLVPAWDLLRTLGINTIPHEITRSARGRILHYFQQYTQIVISHRELMVVSGISEWARRVRELRKEHGWDIISGTAVKEMIENGDLQAGNEIPDLSDMGRDDYIMLNPTQDREAAYRWSVANDIRKGTGGAKVKILTFFLENIGKPVSGEELRYVANDKTEWARRTRELRTEEGWQICTHWNGRPDLAPGMYVLESNRKQPTHDRKIDDRVRRAVLIRDNHACQECGWTHEQWNPSDARHLELHHIEHHTAGGKNNEVNLRTLCNICHDQEHAKD